MGGLIYVMRVSRVLMYEMGRLMYEMGGLMYKMGVLIDSVMKRVFAQHIDSVMKRVFAHSLVSLAHSSCTFVLHIPPPATTPLRRPPWAPYQHTRHIDEYDCRVQDMRCTPMIVAGLQDVTFRCII